MEDRETINELMEEAIMEDSITCPECGEILEPDEAKCSCGWKNPLVSEGLIPGAD